MPGTVITRKYKGRRSRSRCSTTASSSKASAYKSLSAVAKAVTGTHWNGFLFFGLKQGGRVMKRSRRQSTATVVRCAIYTRKSTEEGLEQEFNTLDAQRESGEAYIASQKHEGWVCLPDRYDDGGSPAATWTARPCSGCWPTSRPARSTASWSTRSTG